MNKKLIIAAVSAAVMAPVAAHAESSFYGKIGNVYKIDGFKATGKESKTGLSTLGTRLGFKANSDIGNGLTTHGQLEFDVGSDKELPAVKDVRVGSVGLSGAFGRVDMGNMWSAYFNTFGLNISPTYSLGAFIYSTIGAAPYRASNTIKYSNNFGPVHFELDARFNEDGDTAANAEKIRGEGVGLGISFAVNDSLSFAIASDTETVPKVAAVAAKAAESAIDEVAEVRNSAGVVTTKAAPAKAATLATGAVLAKPEREVKRVGFSGKYSIAGLSIGAGVQSMEDGKPASEDVDSRFLHVSGSFTDNTSWLLGISDAEQGDKEADQTFWGVYHSVGGGLTLLYEASANDNTKWESTSAKQKDGTIHLLGMRINF